MVSQMRLGVLKIMHEDKELAALGPSEIGIQRYTKIMFAHLLFERQFISQPEIERLGPQGGTREFR